MVGERHAALATQADDLRLADAAAAVHLESRCLRLQDVGNENRAVGNLCRVDLRDGIADLTLAGRAGRAGHHDLVEAERLLGECEVLHHGLAGGDGDLCCGRTQADALGPHLVAARRHVEQHVAPVLPGEAPHAGIGQENLDLAERRSGALHRHLAGNPTGLLCRRGKCRREEPDPEEQGRKQRRDPCSRGGCGYEPSIGHDILP